MTFHSFFFHSRKEEKNTYLYLRITFTKYFGKNTVNTPGNQSFSFNVFTTMGTKIKILQNYTLLIFAVVQLEISKHRYFLNYYNLKNDIYIYTN